MIINMNEKEFKKLSLEKQVEIANKRCEELGGKKLVARFRTDDLQIDYYTVSKILNKNNYTLFKGKFYKVLVESEVEKEPVIVEPEKEAVLFSLVKKVLAMKEAKSAYYKISDELLNEWEGFRDKKFEYVSSANLIVIAMLDFMRRNK